MKKHWVMLAALAAALVVFGACGQEAESTDDEARVVTVFGAFVDEEARRFEEAIRPFTEQTGIEVRYEGSSDFETLVFVRAQGGNPPDIAALPQPGLMKRFADNDQLVPLWPAILERIDSNYAPVWRDLGSHNGQTYGVFHRVNVKSLVWYPKRAWEEAGYVPPTTWNEMISLMDRMVANGHTPWAVGMESGGATGWVGTDWIEDIMLRTAGPDLYDQWVTNEIPFDHPAVVEAFDFLAQIWLNPQYVYGGTNSIVTTSFGDGPRPLFENPPRAWMHRQGNFITGFFPEDIQANLDAEVGVFGFPAIDEEYGIPALGGGDQFVVFNDRPEVREFMEFLATWESGVLWAQAGGALFPYLNQDISAYPSALERAAAELLVNATVFRFDASDLMPGEVGAGTFWSGMVDWVGGQDTERVLGRIQSSWPR